MPQPVSDKRVVVMTATQAEIRNLIRLSDQGSGQFEIIFEKDSATSA